MMATTNNTNYNAGMYSYGRASTDDEQDKKEAAIALPIMIVLLLLVRLLFCFCRHKDREEQDRVRRRQPQPSSPGAADGNDVEMAAAEVAEPPLVCTYRKEDGWREGSCGVCLAELDDGEAVRVLPACMHYFHAACVGEWLRTHDTCPLCRAPLVVAPAAAA